MREVVVIGAGLHRYGVYPDLSIVDLGERAIAGALRDANMQWEEIETAFCGTTQRGWSTGHYVCQRMGLTGLGVMNIENASASGSSAFREAFFAVASGAHDIALAFGVDKLQIAGASKASQSSETNESGKEDETFAGPVALFARQAQEYMAEYGYTIDQIADVAVKNRFHASLNPYAQFQQAVTREEVHAAKMIAAPLTRLHCCPWGDGAAAVIVCTPEVARMHTGKICPVVAASVLKSSLPDVDLFPWLTELTARQAYESAGVSPQDLDLVELHDAFTIEEIIYAEALELCPRGEGGRLVEEGVTSLTGKHVINSSGGLLAMGHPLGPTGVGQIAEILWQMRGECGKRQIEKPVNLAMAHMIGAGGVCAIHLFKR